jgi:hypothetical protein
MSISVIIFATGWALAAFFYIFTGLRRFILPPILAMAALLIRHP